MGQVVYRTSIVAELRIRGLEVISLLRLDPIASIVKLYHRSTDVLLYGYLFSRT